MRRHLSATAISMHIVTLQIPEDLYTRIRHRAERSQRSVEAEFLDVLSAALPDAEELPDELSVAIETLDRSTDDELWQAARQQLPENVSSELESLHIKQQRDGLSSEERERSEMLCLEYDRVMLVRARAAALLHARGHDVGSLQANS